MSVRDSTYSIRIGDTRELYDASWRRSCFRVDEKLRHHGFVLIKMEIPEEPMKTNWPRVMSYSDSLGLTMDLDYATTSKNSETSSLPSKSTQSASPPGDFNLFFQTALDVSMDEQLYLQECREHHHVQADKTQIIGEPTMCMCALL